MQETIADESLREELPHVAAQVTSQVRYPAEARALLHVMTLFNPQLLSGVTAALHRHIWLLGINRTGTPLYTSDNPAARFAHLTDPVTSYSGPGAAGIEVAFPLTPSHVLILFDRYIFRYYEESEGQRLTLDAGRVEHYNAMQVVESQRWVFSPTNDFTVAERVCSERPELRDPQRKRVEVVVAGDLIQARRLD
jgi:hypothetical protein